METDQEIISERTSNRTSLVGKIFGEIREIAKTGLYLVPWSGDKRIMRDSSSKAVSNAIITSKYGLLIGIPSFIFYKAHQVYNSLGSELGDTFNMVQETASNAVHLVQ